LANHPVKSEKAGVREMTQAARFRTEFSAWEGEGEFYIWQCNKV